MGCCPGTESKISPSTHINNFIGLIQRREVKFRKLNASHHGVSQKKVFEENVKKSNF